MILNFKYILYFNFKTFKIKINIYFLHFYNILKNHFFQITLKHEQINLKYIYKSKLFFNLKTLFKKKSIFMYLLLFKSISKNHV